MTELDIRKMLDDLDNPEMTTQEARDRLLEIAEEVRLSVCGESPK